MSRNERLKYEKVAEKSCYFVSLLLPPPVERSGDIERHKLSCAVVVVAVVVFLGTTRARGSSAEMCDRFKLDQTATVHWTAHTHLFACAPVHLFIGIWQLSGHQE